MCEAGRAACVCMQVCVLTCVFPLLVMFLMTAPVDAVIKCIKVHLRGMLLELKISTE